MSITDKSLQLKADFDAVYEAGYAAGQGAGGTDERFKSLAEAKIEEINDDTITYARNYAFAYCKSLKTATLSKLEKGDTSIFGYCTSLETVSLPSLKIVPYTCFMGCTALKNVSIPNAGTNYGGFYGCKSLEFLDLPSAQAINAAFFQTNSNFKTLILRYNGVVNLHDINAFGGTPFRNGEGGTVYVKQAYLEQYKTATNWNALESTTFLPIEGSEYE